MKTALLTGILSVAATVADEAIKDVQPAVDKAFAEIPADLKSDNMAEAFGTTLTNAASNILAAGEKDLTGDKFVALIGATAKAFLSDLL